MLLDGKYGIGASGTQQKRSPRVSLALAIASTLFALVQWIPRHPHPDYLFYPYLAIGWTFIAAMYWRGYFQIRNQR